MNHDLKLALGLLGTALILCVVSMCFVHSNWARAFDNLMAENQALEDVIALQATEGDMLVRQIGEMADHGFCEGPDAVGSTDWQARKGEF